MRRSEREITDKARLEEILHQAEVLMLSMIDGGEPYAVPMNFGYRDGSLYLHSALEGRKVDVLRANPKIHFTAVSDYVLMPRDRPHKCTSRYACVMGTGTAVFVTEREEKLAFLQIMMADFGGWQGDAPPDAIVDKTLCIRVDIASMSGKENSK